jgi:pimeloyl-ACP methyl ester carboxylesterase
MMKIFLLTFLVFGLCISGLSQSIQAPIDHHFPDKGSFNLEYEFASGFDPKLPTVVVISDAQQFYVRRGRIDKIRDDIFGSGFNVLGIIPRSTSDSLRNLAVRSNEDIDWPKAYDLFNAFQCVNDINFVIENVLQDQNQIYLYGVSGGAFLISEYLSVFPGSRVQKVFIGSPVNPVIEAQLGLIHDNFEREFLARYRASKDQLFQVLESGFFERWLVANLLQRQNFFVSPDSLEQARIQLIEELYRKDTAAIENYRNIYQIDAIQEFFKTNEGIPIRVRLLEFIAPLLEFWQVSDSLFYPDLENSYHVAEPLIVKIAKNSIRFQPYFSAENARQFKGEVFILSGRYDHVVDYRSSIYLSALFEKSKLLLTKGDHMFHFLKSEGEYNNLVRDFFNYGLDFMDWFEKYRKYQWIEQ